MRTMMVLACATLAAAAVGDDEWSDFATQVKDKDPDKRCSAINLIDQHKSLRMVQALFPLLDDPHPRVRYRAMRAIGRANEPAAFEFLVKTGLKSGKPNARIHTIEALGWIKDEGTQDAVLAMLEDSDALVRAQVADALAWMRAKKAVDALVAAIGKDKAWEGRAAAIEAVGRLDAPRLADVLDGAVADKAHPVRMEIMRAAPKINADAGLKAFKALIADADWRVRVQAIESASEVRHRECVGAIVELFAKEKGRLRLDCWMALQDLTGKDLGLDVKPWRTWWDANKDSFEPVAKAERKGALPDPGGETRAEFFKIPILSHRASFILDLSGSMRDPAPGDDRSKDTKLDVAKRGMVRTISDFAAEVHFNIICLGCENDGTYRRDQKTWKKRLTPANDAGKRDAIKYTNSQEARGWTNIWDGIELALEDADVDTLFLYSDGGASRGVWTTTGEIMIMLGRLNRYRKVMIFTVETPGAKANTEDNIKLLKQLADETKGTYKLAESK